MSTRATVFAVQFVELYNNIAKKIQRAMCAQTRSNDNLRKQERFKTRSLLSKKIALRTAQRLAMEISAYNWKATVCLFLVAHRVNGGWFREILEGATDPRVNGFASLILNGEASIYRLEGVYYNL